MKRIKFKEKVKRIILSKEQIEELIANNKITIEDNFNTKICINQKYFVAEPYQEIYDIESFYNENTCKYEKINIRKLINFDNIDKLKDEEHSFCWSNSNKYYIYKYSNIKCYKNKLLWKSLITMSKFKARLFVNVDNIKSEGGKTYITLTKINRNDLIEIYDI